MPRAFSFALREEEALSLLGGLGKKKRSGSCRSVASLARGEYLFILSGNILIRLLFRRCSYLRPLYFSFRENDSGCCAFSSYPVTWTVSKMQEGSALHIASKCRFVLQSRCLVHRGPHKMAELQISKPVIYSGGSSRGSSEHGFAASGEDAAASVGWIVVRRTVPAGFLPHLYSADPGARAW